MGKKNERARDEQRFVVLFLFSPFLSQLNSAFPLSQRELTRNRNQQGRKKLVMFSLMFVVSL
jgi:hypothetical protein